MRDSPNAPSSNRRVELARKGEYACRPLRSNAGKTERDRRSGSTHREDAVEVLSATPAEAAHALLQGARNLLRARLPRGQ